MKTQINDAVVASEIDRPSFPISLDQFEELLARASYDQSRHEIDIAVLNIVVAEGLEYGRLEFCVAEWELHAAKPTRLAIRNGVPVVGVRIYHTTADYPVTERGVILAWSTFNQDQANAVGAWLHAAMRELSIRPDPAAGSDDGGAVVAGQDRA